jgi:hypothetical protein
MKKRNDKLRYLSNAIKENAGKFFFHLLQCQIFNGIFLRLKIFNIYNKMDLLNLFKNTILKKLLRLMQVTFISLIDLYKS